MLRYLDFFCLWLSGYGVLCHYCEVGLVGCCFIGDVAGYVSTGVWWVGIKERLISRMRNQPFYWVSYCV